MHEPLSSRLVQSRLEQMLSTLRNHDFRITPQRLAILRVLAASEGHPTVESIYEKVKIEFPTTSLATIYKTVSLLKEINEVLELGFADGSNRYDGNRPFPHPHVICTKCKKIVDSEVRDLQEMIRQVARETGFQIFTHRLDFFGLCRNCLNRWSNTV
jgi:Fur family transcriptional regulator, peroxide stress response regulator